MKGNTGDLYCVLSQLPSCYPCKVSVGIASRSEIACRWVKDGVEFFCTAGDLTAPMSWAVSHAIRPLAGQLVVRAAEDRETPGHRRGLEAGLQECSLIELHVVGCDLEGSHPLRLHVPQEIHEIPDDKTFRMQE